MKCIYKSEIDIAYNEDSFLNQNNVKNINKNILFISKILYIKLFSIATQLNKKMYFKYCNVDYKKL